MAMLKKAVSITTYVKDIDRLNKQKLGSVQIAASISKKYGVFLVYDRVHQWLNYHGYKIYPSTTERKESTTKFWTKERVDESLPIIKTSRIWSDVKRKLDKKYKRSLAICHLKTWIDMYYGSGISVGIVGSELDANKKRLRWANHKELLKHYASENLDYEAITEKLKKDLKMPKLNKRKIQAACAKFGIKVNPHPGFIIENKPLLIKLAKNSTSIGDFVKKVNKVFDIKYNIAKLRSSIMYHSEINAVIGHGTKGIKKGILNTSGSIKWKNHLSAMIVIAKKCRNTEELRRELSKKWDVAISNTVFTTVLRLHPQITYHIGDDFVKEIMNG